MINKNFQGKAISKHIVNWIRDYAYKAHVKGLVVGISGGIDSAVVSSLCALTDLPVLCVEMPIHQQHSQQNRAKEHIAKLKENFKNVTSIQTDLTSSFDTLTQILPSSDNTELLNLTLANTRARLRMTTLYYHAGITQSLVVGTGNKIEDFGVGFFTKYGDGGVDISPIADLMKSQVNALAEYLNVIPSIIHAKPTDGLFGDDRSDEDQLGASYPELEKAMIAFENGAIPEDFQGREKIVFEIFTKLNRNNQHKINPIPICEIPKEFL
ncbi:NAD(+) synthase [Myroides sp. LJL119]